MKVLSLSAALLLSLGLSQASLAQGKGHDKPDKHDQGEHAQRGDDHAGKGRGNDAGRREDDHGDRQADRGRDDRGRDHDRGDRVVVVQERREPERVVVVTPNQIRDRSWERDLRIVVVDRFDDRRLIRGCPPGLAKKHNGCLPPGQAKKLERARNDWVWGRPYLDQGYQYDDGYLYRYDRQGSLLGYLPALGGALSVGSLWSTQYNYAPAPAYYTDYYGLNDPYDYRYADGALYGVDPKSSMIQQVVALLTGQSLQVGQQMPAGYDIYNVPYGYRDQYADTADAAYRYNDGALYQLDPKTQVIQAIIQLLT